MLSEFAKLRHPPPEPDQIELICKHAQEKYTIALYGSCISSVSDFLLQAHDLHAALGHRDSNSSRQLSLSSTISAYCLVIHLGPALSAILKLLRGTGQATKVVLSFLHNPRGD